MDRATFESADPIIDALDWDSGQQADERLRAWKTGRTGFPYIDAGMRQLLAAGWVHNRVRMGVASYRVQDRHQPWQRGGDKSRLGRRGRRCPSSCWAGAVERSC